MGEIEVGHGGLNGRRRITGRAGPVGGPAARAREPARARRGGTVEARRARREQAAGCHEAGRAAARARTEAAAAAIAELERLLRRGLDAAGPLSWGALGRGKPFAGARPRPPASPATGPAPDPDDPAYRPRLGLAARLIPGVRRAVVARCREAFEREHRVWAKAAAAADRVHAEAMRDHGERFAAWEAAGAAHEAAQRERAATVERLRTRYLARDPGAVAEHGRLVLARSAYPDAVPREREVAYDAATGMAVVDFRLPIPGDLPTLRRVGYVPSRDVLDEVRLQPAELNRLYDRVVRGIVLRTLRELFAADEAGALRAITFNGWVVCPDGDDGACTRACTVSVQVGRADFGRLDLDAAAADRRALRACFGALAGARGVKPHALAPVAPRARIDPEDGRLAVAVAG